MKRLYALTNIHQPDFILRNNIWRIILSGFILLLLLSSKNSGAQWVQHYSGTQKLLTDISFVNRDTGFVVGQGRLTFGPICMRTMDGGITWDSLLLPSNIDYLTSLHALDATHIYVGGWDNPLIPVLLVSDNLGQSWTDITPDSAKWRITDVEFITPTRGCAIDDYAQIHVTWDGGATWTLDTVAQPDMWNYPYYPQHVCWTDSNTVYLGCWDGSFAYGGAVLKSADGGVNWTVSDFPQDYSQVEAMDFPDSLHGYAAYNGWTGITPAAVIRTQDGGQTWDTLSFTIQNESIFDLAFSSPDTGYAVSTSGFIYKTTDAAQSWTLDFDADTSVYAIDIHDQFVWACGLTGLTLKNNLSTGIETINTIGQYSIYPVPAGNELFIRANSQQNNETTIRLFDSCGRFCFENRMHGSLENISLENIPGGVFILELNDGQKVYHSRIIHSK